MNTKIMNKYYVYLSIIITTLMFNSCFKEPNYSNIPTLAFEKFELNNKSYTLSEAEGYTYFEFTDGDGDLGLITTRINNRDTTITGKIVYSIPKYNSTFPRTDTLSFPEITNSNGIFPKKGEIRIRFASIFDPSTALDPRFISKNFDTLTLKFWIIDRAGNKSNEVITPEFILKLR